MSETVHYKGTLRKIEKLPGESLEEQCKRLLKNAELPSYFYSYEEFLTDRHSETMIIHNDSVYEIDKIRLDGDSDIFNSRMRKDEKIAFEVRYYNGGCGFEEAIEEALKNIDES